MQFKLAPSILSADFGNLSYELGEAQRAGAHYAHIDVMDGHFVPNISIGVPVIKSLRKSSNLVFDVHLMISSPVQYIRSFAEAGADIINFHFEAVENHLEVIKQIRSLGKKAAMTIKPGTDVEKLFSLAGFLDMVLLMSVEPGFSGQQFNEDALFKAEKLRNFTTKNNLELDIEMDGGIKLSNVKTVISSGVNVIVAGSAIFEHNIYEETTKFLKFFNSLHI